VIKAFLVLKYQKIIYPPHFLSHFFGFFILEASIWSQPLLNQERISSLTISDFDFFHFRDSFQTQKISIDKLPWQNNDGFCLFKNSVGFGSGH